MRFCSAPHQVIGVQAAPGTTGWFQLILSSMLSFICVWLNQLRSCWQSWRAGRKYPTMASMMQHLHPELAAQGKSLYDDFQFPQGMPDATYRSVRQFAPVV